MTAEEISLLQSSFRKISPHAEQAASLFYARLFELEPTSREFFRGDLTEQGRRLLQLLGQTIQGIARLDTLAPLARQLGLHQGTFHAKDRHYDAVGEALLWTLSKGLGADFTDATRAAWGKIYWLMAEITKAGARDGAAKLLRAAA